MSYYSFHITIFAQSKRVYFSSFLSMSVNLIQNHGTVWAFNNREIISYNRSNLYSGINLQQFHPVLLILFWIKFLIEKIILVLFSIFVSSIRFNTRYVASLPSNVLYVTSVTAYTYHIRLYFIIIKQSGDVKENPGPQYNSCQSFPIFSWNLNNICAYNFIKLPFLHVYIVSLKLFWIAIFYLMMLIWIFLDII